MKKTNAMRILESENIDFEIIEYSTKDGIGGVDVAEKLGEDKDRVFKTLVTESKEGENFVFVVPVSSELDLKKAAKASGSKKVEMIPQKKLLPLTGYVHGGCSPVGMKKEFKTFIDSSAENLDFFYVSGGKVGMQIKLNPKELVNLIDGEFADIKKE
ncbi:Cys-tRNA(Pro) deacylase [Peptoniphilus harei]|uniref:Cys-tRNA(Pro)/Cys-tRNA(Cys) deacylase n=2 Tax=Peptoniphilus harei TaxID=54005 RepID=A0A2X1Y560_9FIRM|nr:MULTISPECIES: Cys-tRNA(Pro) deacylase [Peptoniphilus]MBS6534327.1 Cys-tRNA(Pro) deacylase [Peptoniphilus harei]MDU5470298.1 Cys-tRNA(Pro) deacylase [Peptoniphilus harei]MDU6097585.1 Cys-tRNA(Pro) deacylase [Peptoniphilus harei]OFO60071.1 aminoacyl-tRNA deacylase [Peptoniphilus sp. HMSC075B08]QQT90893.1 Cys-tRNA(Pro) deacylase [Peptoniphilus harei]